MAEIAFTHTRKGNLLTFEWLAATEADTFAEIYINDNVSDVLIEAEGTFGSATVTLNSWVVTEAAVFAAVDPGGSAVSMTSDGSSGVRDCFPFFRPIHSGGSSETIDVRMQMRLAKQKCDT